MKESYEPRLDLDDRWWRAQRGPGAARRPAWPGSAAQGHSESTVAPGPTPSTTLFRYPQVAGQRGHRIRPKSGDAAFRCVPLARHHSHGCMPATHGFWLADERRRGCDPADLSAHAFRSVHAPCRPGGWFNVLFDRSQPGDDEHDRARTPACDCSDRRCRARRIVPFGRGPEWFRVRGRRRSVVGTAACSE